MQHQTVTGLLCHARMRAEDTLVRLERFREECRKLGIDGPVELQAKFGRRASFWSDLFHGRKSFGEKLARSLEEQMGLPRNTLDMVQAGHPRTFAELNGFEGQLVTLFRQLDPDAQHDTLRLLQGAASSPQTAKSTPPTRD